MFGKTLKLNAEYYYTDFRNQAVVDYDANKGLISIYNLIGKSYSHTFQIDASYPLLKGLEITAACQQSMGKRFRANLDLGTCRGTDVLRRRESTLLSGNI